MAHVRTFIAAVLVCGALVAAAVGNLSRAQAMPGSDGVHDDFACTITAVAKAGDDVTGVTLALDPNDKNAANWHDWLAANVGTNVWLGFSPHWHAEFDAGRISNNAGDAASIDLTTPGTPTFFTAEVGQTVHIFYGGDK